MEATNNTTTLSDSDQFFERVSIKEEKCWPEEIKSEPEDQLDTENCLKETVHFPSEPVVKSENDITGDGTETHIKTEIEPEAFFVEATEEKFQHNTQHLNATYETEAVLPGSFEKSSWNALSSTAKGFETTKDYFDCKANTSCDVNENFTKKNSREETVSVPDLEQSHKSEICDSVNSSASLLDKHCRAPQDGSRKFKCEICDKSFKWHTYLKSHVLLHAGKSPYKCHLCEKSFTRISNLKAHILTHEGKRPHKCSICDRSFTEYSNLKKHYLIHEGKKPYKCEICEKSFTQMAHLRVHILVHEDKKNHNCKICDKSFARVSYLKRHSKIHEHPYKCEKCERGFTDLVYLKQHALVHEEERPHRCKVCGNGFKRLSHLRNHNKSHKSLKPPENCEEKCIDVSEQNLYKNEGLNQSFEKSTWNALSSTANGLETTKDYFDCKVNTSCEANENFTKEETVILPDLEQPLKSETCVNVKPSASLLDNLNRTSQDDSRKLKCEVCDRNFKWHSCLKSHMLLHAGQSPYKCHLCEKSFTRLSHLKTHILTHEGKKPHKCCICDRSFTEYSNLKKHYLIHEGKKPFKCEICEKSFTQMVHLRVHNLVHENKKDHSCKICGKSFACVSYLKRHSKIHEHPYKCDKCEKGFTDIAYLKQHALIHEERPHKCMVCGNGFKRLVHLRNHNKTHKSLKPPENCEEKCIDVSEQKV